MQITVSSEAKGKMQILVRVSSVVTLLSPKPRQFWTFLKRNTQWDDKQNSVSDMFSVSTVVTKGTHTQVFADCVASARIKRKQYSNVCFKRRIGG